MVEIVQKRVKTYWAPGGRCLVFILAFSSIGCLLADFYHLCPMRIFAGVIFLPALAALAGLAWLDWWNGNGWLCRAVCIGLTAGLVAAVV